MSSEISQGYLWIPCEFYSSLANQIMCNKQSALELFFPSSHLHIFMYLWDFDLEILTSFDNDTFHARLSKESFLCCVQSIAALMDNFVRRLFVHLCVCVSVYVSVR